MRSLYFRWTKNRTNRTRMPRGFYTTKTRKKMTKASHGIDAYIKKNCPGSGKIRRGLEFLILQEHGSHPDAAEKAMTGRGPRSPQTDSGDVVDGVQGMEHSKYSSSAPKLMFWFSVPLFFDFAIRWSPRTLAAEWSGQQKSINLDWTVRHCKTSIVINLSTLSSFCPLYHTNYCSIGHFLCLIHYKFLSLDFQTIPEAVSMRKKSPVPKQWKWKILSRTSKVIDC